MNLVRILIEMLLRHLFEVHGHLEGTNFVFNFLVR